MRRAAASPGPSAWRRRRGKGAQNRKYFPSTDKTRLTFSVPETDNVQFTASCGKRSSGRLAVVEFGADVASASDGARVQLRVSGRGFSQTLKGTAVVPASEAGFSGVRVSVRMDNPLWAAMQRGGSLSYGLAGGAPQKLSLNDADSPTANFLRNCSNFGAAGAPGNPGQGDPAPFPVAQNGGGGRSMSCKNQRRMRSANGGLNTTVTFVNRTQETRAVLWFDFAGQPKDYGMLEPGQSKAIQTWTTHPWMFTDGPGNCIEMYMPAAGSPTFSITRPSPGFGAE